MVKKPPKKTNNLEGFLPERLMYHVLNLVRRSKKKKKKKERKEKTKSLVWGTKPSPIGASPRYSSLYNYML